MSVNEWMNKQIVVSPYNGIWLSDKQEWIIDIGNNIDESQTMLLNKKRQIQKAIDGRTLCFHSCEILGKQN